MESLENRANINAAIFRTEKQNTRIAIDAKHQQMLVKVKLMVLNLA
jgi:outer membrane receptor for monomeric catechols